MKTHTGVSSQRRKCRKAHFSASSLQKYKLMSVGLSKDLRSKHGIRSLPIRKEDEVEVLRGKYKETKGKVTQVYRKKNCIYVEKISKEKSNGAVYTIPIEPSNCRIMKLKLTADRENLIKRKSDGVNADKNKGKYTEKEVKA